MNGKNKVKQFLTWKYLNIFFFHFLAYCLILLSFMMLHSFLQKWDYFFGKLFTSCCLFLPFTCFIDFLSYDKISVFLWQMLAFLFLWWFSVLQLSIFIKTCRISALGAPQICSLLWNRRKFFLRKNIPPKIISISQKRIFSLLWGRFLAVVQRDKLSIRIFSNERALCCNAHLSFKKHPKIPTEIYALTFGCH